MPDDYGKLPTIQHHAPLNHELKVFDKNTIHSLFIEMGRIAHENNLYYEVSTYGGSTLALLFDWRKSTCDVDYVPQVGTPEAIDDLANQAAQNLGLPKDCFRNDVQLFISMHPEFSFYGEYPEKNEKTEKTEKTGLSVFTASPEYLLAMKIVSMRSSRDAQDSRDVWFLIDECQISDADQAMKIVAAFYPDEEIPKRNLCILNDLFQAKLAGESLFHAYGVVTQYRMMCFSLEDGGIWNGYVTCRKSCRK